MKKILAVLTGVLSLNCLVAYGQFPVPQLQAGIFINDTIVSQTYQFAGCCNALGAPDVTLSLGAGLAPVATGVELKYIVTACPLPPDTAFCLQTGIVHVGDTLSFPSAAAAYTFYTTPNAGSISFALVITGTPAVPFETYPCSLLIVITLADCANSMMTLDAGIPCSVGDYSALPETRSAAEITISPNPAASFFDITTSTVTTGEMEFRIYDLRGRVVHAETFQPGFLSKRMDTGNFDDGMYLCKATLRHDLIYSGKLVVVRED